MGFFSKIRKRIKKIIPREIRPFVPYLAAAIPGLAGASGFLANQGISSALARKALVGGATRYLSDDEADLKDIGITAALAAAPSALGEYAKTGNAAALKMGDPGFFTQQAKLGAAKLSGMAADKPFTTLAAQGGIDAGIKAAELNEEALDEYNRMLAQQGITDRKERRSAIRAIYEGTGTWDMDEVDSMLDTYGYRTGGRVGYADGDMVLTNPSMVTPEQQRQIQGNQMAEQAYNEIFQKFMERFPGLATGEETLEEMIAMLQQEKVIETPGLGILGAGAAMDMITPESAGASARRIMMGDTQYGDFTEEKRNGGRIGYKKGSRVGGFSEDDYEMFLEGIESAGEGLEDLEEADDEIKPLPIRELRLADGGDVDDVMEFDEEIITPEYLMKEEGVEIGEQVSSPNKMDDLNQLSLDMFGKPVFELSESEFEALQDLASQQALKPGLIDDYRNYKYQMEEQGITPMSPRDYFRNEFGAARLGVKKGGKVIKIMPEGVLYKGKAKDYPGIKQLIKDMKKKGTRKGKADGGLMNLGGNEMDLRGGGFVPMGAKERADDVPARLSKNEFVMTADAVRAAGGGSVQKGADLMYDQMKRLERKA